MAAASVTAEHWDVSGAAGAKEPVRASTRKAPSKRSVRKPSWIPLSESKPNRMLAQIEGEKLDRVIGIAAKSIAHVITTAIDAGESAFGVANNREQI